MKHIRSSAAILISVILLLALPVCSNALGDGRDFYVDDGAGIISSSDRERIIEMNEALFAMTGAEIVVVTVNTTPDGNVFSAAKEILENESIGSAERSNGMVLLYSKEESNYWFLPDSGAAEVLDTASVKTLCSSVLEPGLASSNYSLAIVSFVSAVAAELEEAYGVNLSAWNGEQGSFTKKVPDNTPYSEKKTGELFTVLLYIALAALAVIVIVIIVLIIRAHISSTQRRVIKKRKRLKNSTALSFAKGIDSLYKRK